MGQKESPRSLSDKNFWNQIYREMKEMLKSQQFQIETLINDRGFLENYVHCQNEQWRCRSRFLESYISQLKEEQAKTCLAEDAKKRVFVGCKELESLRYKKQFELAESDLEDCLSCIKAESSEIEELKDKLKSFEAVENACCTCNVSGSEKVKGMDQSVMSLKKELKKLKHAYSELSSSKDAEIFSLLAEKDFVWNQFKMMEGNYVGILKIKCAESDQDKEALEKLQNSVEELQLSIGEMDKVIAKLEADKALLELDIRKHVGESKLFVNKMKKFHSDMDEQRLTVIMKDELIAHLSKELCNIKGDSKKSIFEKSSVKARSEGKSQRCLNTISQIQSGPRKRNLNTCDTSINHKCRSPRGVCFETSALKGDSKKSILEKSSVKARSEGKPQSCLKTISQIQSGSRKRNLESCDTDSKKSILEKSSVKAEGKSQRCLNTISQIQSGSRKRNLNTCDTSINHKCRSPRGVYFETSALKGDSKKSILENSSVKARSEGKPQSCLNTISQIQSNSRKRNLESCDAGRNHKRRIPHGVYFETPPPNNDHGIHQHLIKKKARTISPAELRSIFFHSGFKIPKLK